MCGTNSGVHSAADFKGKTLGVTDLGSGTDALTQFLAAQKGIEAPQYHRLAVGAGATAIAAIQGGTAQCVMTTQPTVTAMEQKKHRLLGDRPGHHGRRDTRHSAAPGPRPGCSPGRAG